MRDRLLGLPINEKDWVVVGATPEIMMEQGYVPVGKSFPVFLHPDSKEEYALARTEKKAGRGYHGFTFYSSPDVSLEQDLVRRDITINSMAEDEDGNIIDPYGGQEDLKNRIVRHTSPAFVEDPLRVLRVARFLAQFHHLRFKLAQETKDLLSSMLDELDTISAERIWTETTKALSTHDPQVFFEVLHEIGGLDIWFPELERLFGVPQPAKYHPEIDCGVHSMMVLKQASLLSDEVSLRFAALVHDLGKGLTPAKILPSHHGHEEKGVPEVQRICRRLSVPKEVEKMAVLCCRYHGHAHKADEMRPTTILKLLDAFDLWRRPERFEQYLLLCKADSRGRLGMEKLDYQRGDYLGKIAAAVKDLDIQQIIAGLSDKEKPEAIRKARIDAITAFRAANPPNFSKHFNDD